MAEKMGSEFARDMRGRGFRELGGVFFPDSNIAQPQYPLRGGYVKEPEVPTVEAHQESMLEEHVVEAGRGGHDDPSRDEHEHDRY